MKKTWILYTLFLGLLFSCGGSLSSNSEKTFRAAFNVDITSLDPHLLEDLYSANVSFQLFHGLVVYNEESGGYDPGMAEKLDISPDGLVWTATIRDALWSDGTPLTAFDFQDAWLRLLNPDSPINAPYASLFFQMIKGAEDYYQGKISLDELGIQAPDEKTLIITLRNPAPYFQGMLSMPVFTPLPMHVIKIHGDEWTKPENIVTNGPYVIKDHVIGNRLVLTKNPHYYRGPENVYIETAEYLFDTSGGDTSYDLYVRGEIDALYSPSEKRAQAIMERDDVIFENSLNTSFFFINPSEAPLDDIRVRRALSISINRAELASLVLDFPGNPLSGFIPASMPGYPSLITEDSQAHQAEAQALLAEAGYPNGQGFPKIHVTINSSEKRRKVTEYIQRTWADVLGIQVEIDIYDFSNFLSIKNRHDYDITSYAWVADYEDANSFFDIMRQERHSPLGKVIPTFFTLLDTAEKQTNNAQRLSYLAQAEKVLMDSQLVIPAYTDRIVLLFNNKKWTGWKGNPIVMHDISRIQAVEDQQSP